MANPYLQALAIIRSATSRGKQSPVKHVWLKRFHLSSREHATIKRTRCHVAHRLHCHKTLQHRHNAFHKKGRLKRPFFFLYDHTIRVKSELMFNTGKNTTFSSINQCTKQQQEHNNAETGFLTIFHMRLCSPHQERRNIACILFNCFR